MISPSGMAHAIALSTRRCATRKTSSTRPSTSRPARTSEIDVTSIKNLTLKIWRQKNRQDRGGFETYQVKNISSEMSFLEMFDVLNERLINEGKDPIAFDHDCREGICGMCSMHINGRPHGPQPRPQSDAVKFLLRWALFTATATPMPGKDAASSRRAS